MISRGPVRTNREAAASSAIAVAYEFLGRWGDGFTQSVREEIAQESALIAWDRQHTLRNPRKFAAFVRTIARRLRFKAARESMRRPEVSIDREDGVGDALVEPSQEPVVLAVMGQEVDRNLLLQHMGDALNQLTRLNRALLLSYYEGFSCAELAARFGMTEDAVKVRVHRARVRVREVFEKWVRSLRRRRTTGDEAGRRPGPARMPKHDATKPTETRE